MWYLLLSLPPVGQNNCSRGLFSCCTFRHCCIGTARQRRGCGLLHPVRITHFAGEAVACGTITPVGVNSKSVIRYFSVLRYTRVITRIDAHLGHRLTLCVWRMFSKTCLPLPIGIDIFSSFDLHFGIAGERLLQYDMSYPLVLVFSNIGFLQHDR